MEGSRNDSLLTVSVVAVILSLWLIFLLEKKDEKIKKLEREKLKGLKKKIDQEQLDESTKKELSRLIDKYQGINPRVAFELVKALSSLNIEDRTGTFLTLVSTLENILTDSYAQDIVFSKWFEQLAKGGTPTIEDYLIYGMSLGTLTQADVNFAQGLIQQRNQIVHNPDAQDSENWISANLLVCIELILKLDIASSPQIFSIGHGSKSIGDFIRVLKRYQISTLIDVRSSPHSEYNPHFNQSDLIEPLDVNGIEYNFMGDTLGGRPRDKTCYLDGKVSYNIVREKHFFKNGITELLLKSRNKRVAIMCSEGKPHECHRSKLIGKYLTNLDVSLLHIDYKGILKSQYDVMLQATKGLNETGLFGEEPIQSRKKYT